MEAFLLYKNNKRLSMQRAKTQRNLSEDTHFVVLKGKFLNRYIGVTDFEREVFVYVSRKHF